MCRAATLPDVTDAATLTRQRLTVAEGNRRMGRAAPDFDEIDRMMGRSVASPRSAPRPRTKPVTDAYDPARQDFIASEHLDPGQRSWLTPEVRARRERSLLARVDQIGYGQTYMARVSKGLTPGPGRLRTHKPGVTAAQRAEVDRIESELRRLGDPFSSGQHPMFDTFRQDRMMDYGYGVTRSPDAGSRLPRFFDVGRGPGTGIWADWGR